ncbi:hypothetical protein BDP27DRAFT_1317499 [Rhodocollybia butyracea]|uniref:F-box domain-containing protein n=1 Tax=Rhodocollybia butyracea TaxID=206335 RepID=A0A9P5Q5Z9_9AGAR|nr:hypothetical protein BDP27DRAFT_1317499 [Rhodocollybia butyracea]
MEVSIQLTELPPELLVYIFSYLSAYDLTSCAYVNRAFHAVISGSVFLQYSIQLFKSCALDNRNSHLSYSEKLRLLQQREESFNNCIPDFQIQVPLPFNPGSVYDLSGDVYLLGDNTRQSLQYLRLPNTPDQTPQWSRLHSGDKYIVDFGVNLQEHDLIALVTAEVRERSGSSSVLSIELALRQFSTGRNHPKARVPSIPVVVSELRFSTPSINLEIVGRYLALVTTFWRNPSAHCVVTVYEWQSGRVVMEIDGNPETYSGVVFLSEDVILLPNTQTRALEIWNIPGPNEHQPSAPVMQLALPKLLPDNVLRFISCRAEPNPIGSGSDLKHSTRPFHYDPLNSIVLLHLRVNALHLSSLFTIFVHRRALLDLLPPNAPFGDIDREKQVPWSEWAPSRTCSVDLEGQTPSRWITTTCGQRFVFLPTVDDDDNQSYDDLRRRPSPIVLFDFNPHNVRQAERELAKDSSVTKVVDPGGRVLDAQETFAEEIVSYLPYVVTATYKRHRLDGVLMDEERVIGLQTDARGHIKYIEIFHFG